MKDAAYREAQFADRYNDEVGPINRYVDEVRQVGRGWVPYVAPLHGGINARVLSVLRDPGPATQDGTGSGFICVENDDGSAELQSQLLEAAGMPPGVLLPWNAYPWYINSAPNAAQLEAGVETLLHLLGVMLKLRVILLQGNSAAAAWKRVLRRAPSVVEDRGLRVIYTYHPSPQALFARDPEERARRVARREAAFFEVAEALVP